jgi:uncharacterized membrane protein
MRPGEYPVARTPSPFSHSGQTSIALAIGYLVWGIRSGQRAWRIGSLLLMLVAVAKVFLLDASGLEGLLRIVSFLALGFSLIGIGWLYSRYLKPDTT